MSVSFTAKQVDPQDSTKNTIEDQKKVAFLAKDIFKKVIVHVIGPFLDWRFERIAYKSAHHVSRRKMKKINNDPSIREYFKALRAIIGYSHFSSESRSADALEINFSFAVRRDKPSLGTGIALP